MKKKPEEDSKKLDDLKHDVLMHLELHGPTHRLALLSRFDPYIKGKLDAVLVDLEAKKFIKCVKDDKDRQKVSITPRGTKELMEEK